MELTEETMALLARVLPGNAAIYRLRGDAIETIYASPSLPALNGMTAAEYRALTERDAAAVVLPQDLPMLLDTVRRTVRTGEPLDCYFRAVHRKLGFDWVHAHASLCGEQNGFPILLVSYTNASVETDSYQNILDHSRARVYVCDRHTYELLYLNRAAREAAPQSGVSFAGSTCYQYLCGRGEVCENCYLQQIRKSRCLRAQTYHEDTGVYEKVTGELIRWCGRDAFVVYLDDITPAMRKQRELENVLESERQTATDVQVLNGTAPLGDRVSAVLRHMRDYLQADRAYLFEIDERDGTYSNTYEVCAPGVTPQKDNLQRVDARCADGWLPTFLRHRALIVPDLNTIRNKRPEEYALLARQQIRSYAETPLFAHGRLIGFLGADNPAAARLSNAGDILMTLAYAISNALVRDRSEQALRRSEHRYQLAVGGADLGVWEYHIREHRMTNPSSRLRDYRLPDVVENFPAAVLPKVLPDDREKLLALHRRVDAGEPLAADDVWIRWREDAPPACEHIVYSVTRDETGAPDVAYGVSINVTAQQEERRRFARAMTDLLTANPDALGVLRVNLTRNLCAEGHSAAPFLEAATRAGTLDELLAALLLLIPAEAERAEFLRRFDPAQLLAAFRAGETSRQFEFRRPGGSGKPSWIRAFLRMLRNPETEELEGVLCLLDVTKERQQSEILRIVTEREYDLIALVHVDEGTVEAFRLGPTLPESYRALLPKPGAIYPLADFRKNAMEKWLNPEDRALYARCSDPDFYRPRMDRDGRTEFTLRESFPDRGGETYRRFQHYYLCGDRNTILVLESDVTERYRRQEQDLEKERALRRQADAANAAKSDFLSRMSHDIRTPLNGIIGMTYLAARQPASPEVADCLSKIGTSSRFLLGLVNDILDMSKAESGKIELHPEPYRAEDFERYLDAVIAPLCRERHQRFLREIVPLPGCAALVDPLWVNQIFFNILSNAVKYTAEGGTILLRLTCRALPGNRAAMEAEIRDNGIGISEEFQKVLFDPFTQEGRSDVSETRGSGLGLSITKKLVDLMGGTIRVRSRLGEGTSFFLQLEYPCAADPGPAGTRAAPEEGEPLRGKRALLCEDHPLNQEIAKALLAGLGLCVALAEDGQAGLRAFEKSPPRYYDLILMDLRMPVMDGCAAARAIRALDRADAKTVPIVAMTADAFEEDRRRARESGMDGYLTKPVDPAELRSTLLRVLRRDG